MTDITITWPQVLRALTEGRELSADQATWAMESILTGDATPGQIGAFAMGLRAKGETAGEISALVPVMLAHASLVPEGARPGVRLDVVGTGGDHSHSVNISTMSALVAAACGAPVAKHGNRAASSSTGAADVLQELGLVIELEPEQIAATIDAVGIGFCFAPRHHPALRHAGPVRREIGIPTFFNVLGPLSNPGLATASLIGCADPTLAPVLAAALPSRGIRGIVVRGDDGLDEITTSTTTTAWDARTDEVVCTSIDPSDFGIAPVDAVMLRGGDHARNAELLRKTLGAVADTDPDIAQVRAIRDAVALNSAGALVSYDAAIGAPVLPLRQALTARLADARAVIDSGAALELLDRWVALTQKLAR